MHRRNGDEVDMRDSKEERDTRGIDMKECVYCGAKVVNKFGVCQACEVTGEIASRIKWKKQIHL